MRGKEADSCPDLRMLLSVHHLLLQEALSCLQAVVPHQSLCNDKHAKKNDKQTREEEEERETITYMKKRTSPWRWLTLNGGMGKLEC